MCFLDKEKVYAFDSRTLVMEQDILHHLDYVDKHCSKTLMTFDNRYFICTSSYDPQKSIFEYRVDESKIEQRASMHLERCNHAFIELKHNFLLAISGGYPESEIYNVKEDSWHLLTPLLNIVRWRHVALVFEERIIYVYGGRDTKMSPVCSYERIELNANFDGKWELGEFSHKDEDTPIYYHCCFQLNKSEYLIFGGKNKMNLDTNTCLVFDTEKSSICISPQKIPQNDYFYGTAVTYYYGNKYYVFSVTGGLHIYNGIKWISIKGFVH